MAANFKFPGVYPSIRDLSGVVAMNAVTTCAFVGEAEFGPINTPVLLSSLANYTDRFGSLNSRFGYAGYSLAVAAESINSHYFVRVVHTGTKDPGTGELIHEDTDASFGATSVLRNTSALPTPAPSDGFWYEEVLAAQQDSGALFNFGGVRDLDTAFIVVANDPNNRRFSVTVEDSTINENRASLISGISVEEESGDTGRVFATVTTAASVVDGLEVGMNITITRMSDPAYNGTFRVIDFTISGQTATVTYIARNPITFTPNFEVARIGRYPDDNQTTFTLNVFQTIGRVTQLLETFTFCTLYPARDNFGNSMFLEDMVNGSSNFIQVFVNPNWEDGTPEDEQIAIPQFFTTNAMLTGGQSGSKPTSADLNAGWEHFRDRSQIQVSLLMNSGYVNKGDYSYQSKMLEIAEHRRDCFCLFDIPMTETGFENAIDWRRNVQGFNSYRAAMSSPWVRTFDSVQGRANFVMCPSAYIAKVMGPHQPWVAPAGLNRAIIGSSTVSPTGLTQYYNDIEGGVLYTDNQINIVKRNPGAGFVNWGQRTMQARPSALDRINVARTIIFIETTLRDAARWHLFENNTSYNRMQITLQFSSFLDTVLTAEGIQRYVVICDESNNPPIVIANNQLVIDIYLWPTYTAEVIRLNTSVMGADTSVSVTSSAG